MDLNLKEVYEEIAHHFDSTRFNVWPCVSKFLDELPKDSMGLEIGCGNGKNILYRDDLKMEGIDFCNNFVKICENKGLDVTEGDMRDIKKDDNKYDFTMSVAALHHLYNKEDRIKSIKEQIRVTKENGLIFILVWALEQDGKHQPRKFKSQDEMVSWKERKSNKTYYRYYHLYKEGELEEEMKGLNIKVINSFLERGNYGIIVKKLK